MDYTTAQVKNGQYHINGKFSNDEVTREKNSIIEKVRKEAVIPGFRKGKVPANILKMRMGKEYLETEVKKNLLEKEWEGLVRTLLEKSIVQTDLVSAELNDNDELDFVINVDTIPEFEVENYKGVSVEKLNIIVTDEDVKQEIDGMIEKHSKLEEVTGRNAQNGDFAIIEFDGKIDGNSFEGGYAKEYMLELGSNSFIGGFEEGVVGMNIGEEKVINLTFPEDYHHADYAGKPVDFHVKLIELKNKVFPKVDDDFAKECEYENLEDMKTKIKDNLLNTKEQQDKNNVSDKIIRKISEKIEIDPPAPLVEDRINLKLREFEQMLNYQRLSLKEYCERFNFSIEALREQYRLKAFMEVKSEMVLKQIFRIEGMEITEEDIEKELEMIAEMNKRDLNKIRILYSDPDRKEYLKEQIMLTKTVDFLVENADIQIVDKLSESDDNTAKSETNTEESEMEMQEE